MKAVLGKDKKPKKGDVVQFGTYDDQPIKWKVINVSPYEHKALLIADSYCGEATTKDYFMGKIHGMITDLMEECFFPDEQKLICVIRLLTDDDISKYFFSEDDLKFYPYGTGNDAKPYWYCNNDGFHFPYYVRTAGSLGRTNGDVLFSLRPVMWIKYDCVPAEEDTGEEQK